LARGLGRSELDAAATVSFFGVDAFVTLVLGLDVDRRGLDADRRGALALLAGSLM
jgi:hypothetical protein